MRIASDANPRQSGIVRFQLPEGIDSVNVNDLSITVSIQLKDEDASGADHDTVDINSEARMAGEVRYNLETNDIAGQYAASSGFDYLSSPQDLPEMRGSKIKGYDTNDARLRVRISDTVPSHFIQGLKLTKIGAVAGLDTMGKDFFGNMDELEP